MGNTALHTRRGEGTLGLQYTDAALLAVGYPEVVVPAGAVSPFPWPCSLVPPHRSLDDGATVAWAGWVRAGLQPLFCETKVWWRRLTFVVCRWFVGDHCYSALSEDLGVDLQTLANLHLKQKTTIN